jgi:hypothetical protein
MYSAMNRRVYHGLWAAVRSSIVEEHPHRPAATYLTRHHRTFATINRCTCGVRRRVEMEPEEKREKEITI